MAIFSRTQIPKYQNPIRITRPYIEPNYLADTINSAIQGYGSIQNTNMQRQLFNAKLKAAADTKAQNALDQVAVRQAMGLVGTGAQAAVDPITYMGPMGAGPMVARTGSPTVPGMSPLDSVRAAMQNNPQANPASLLRVASQLKTLQDKPTSTADALRLQLAIASGERAKEAHGWRGDKHAATMGNLVEKENLNFLLRFDNAVSELPGLQEWDTPWTSGGSDLTGPDALKAFGATLDDEGWSSMRQKAVSLYRHLKDNTALTETEIDDAIFKTLPAGVRERKSNVFMGDTVTQKVQPSEIVKLMGELLSKHGN